MTSTTTRAAHRRRDRERAAARASVALLGLWSHAAAGSSGFRRRRMLTASRGARDARRERRRGRGAVARLAQHRQRVRRVGVRRALDAGRATAGRSSTLLELGHHRVEPLDDDGRTTRAAWSCPVTMHSRTSARSDSGRLGATSSIALRLLRGDGHDERVEVRRRRTRAGRRAPRTGSLRTRRRRCGRRCRRAHRLLGAHVERRAEDGAGDRERVLFSSSRNLLTPKSSIFGHDAPVAILVQEDVRRLEIAVDDAAAVGRRERPATSRMIPHELDDASSAGAAGAIATSSDDPGQEAPSRGRASRPRPARRR